MLLFSFWARISSLKKNNSQTTEILNFLSLSSIFLASVVLPAPEGEDKIKIKPLFDFKIKRTTLRDYSR